MPLRCLSCFITFFITFRLYGVPRWQPAEKGQDSGHCYDTNSYRKAVESAIRACRQAIKDRGGDPETELPKWTPHRLRHTAATKARRVIELDKPVTQTAGYELARAWTDQGRSLVLDHSLHHQARISKDSMKLGITINLAEPEHGDSVIEQLAGRIELLTVGEDITEIDSGLVELELDRRIQLDDWELEVKPSQWQENMQVAQLYLDLPVGAFDSAVFYDEHGEEFEVRSGGRTSSQDRLLHVDFQTEQFPERFRMVVTLKEDILRSELDFELRDLPIPMF